MNNAGFGTYGTFAGLDPGREHAEVMVNAVAIVEQHTTTDPKPAATPPDPDARG